ncbi:MAG: hypothetical protein WBW33_23380 [Bryobacteraceae bacterium]
MIINDEADQPKSSKTQPAAPELEHESEELKPEDGLEKISGGGIEVQDWGFGTGR